MYRPLILGQGQSGKSAFRLFLKENIIPLLYDDQSKTAVDFTLIDRVVVSPGFTQEHPLIQMAYEKGIKVQSEVDLALEKMSAGCLIGITGSNGKSTCVKKMEHVFLSLGFKAKALGNIEIPLTSEDLSGYDIVVIEMSAQQLETTHSRVLDLGVILNIQPNHLDRYHTMERYEQVKRKIFHLVREGGTSLGPNTSMEEIWDWVAKKFSIDKEKIYEALTTYQNLPHRIEYLGDFFGKKIYNDSKSTTISSTLYALNAVEGPVQLILGGRSKGENLLSFRENLLKRPLKRILAIGETMHIIKEIFDPKIEVVLCETLEKAVDEGLKGEGNLLLSPGFASYDQFNSYAHRGESFKQRIEWEKKMLS
ncbi:MAG: Mur ligase family protein [Chlamydiia bacterium]